MLRWRLALLYVSDGANVAHTGDRLRVVRVGAPRGSILAQTLLVGRAGAADEDGPKVDNGKEVLLAVAMTLLLGREGAADEDENAEDDGTRLALRLAAAMTLLAVVLALSP